MTFTPEAVTTDRFPASYRLLGAFERAEAQMNGSISFKTPKDTVEGLLQVAHVIREAESSEELRLRIWSDASRDLIENESAIGANISEGPGYRIKNAEAHLTSVPSLWYTPETIARALHTRLTQTIPDVVPFNIQSSSDNPHRFTLRLTAGLRLIIDTSKRSRMFGGDNLARHGGKIQLFLAVDDADGTLEHKKTEIVTEKEQKLMVKFLDKESIRRCFEAMDPDAIETLVVWRELTLHYHSMQELTALAAEHGYTINEKTVEDVHVIEFVPSRNDRVPMEAHETGKPHTYQSLILLPREFQQARRAEMQKQLTMLLKRKLVDELAGSSADTPLYFFVTDTNQLLPTRTIKRFCGIKDVPYPLKMVADQLGALLTAPRELFEDVRTIDPKKIPTDWPKTYSSVVCPDTESFELTWTIVRNPNPRSDDPEVCVVCWNKPPTQEEPQR